MEPNELRIFIHTVALETLIKIARPGDSTPNAFGVKGVVTVDRMPGPPG